MQETNAVPPVIEENSPNDKQKPILGDERRPDSQDSVEEIDTTDAENTTVEIVPAGDERAIEQISDTGLESESPPSPVFEETEDSGHAASGREEC